MSSLPFLRLYVSEFFADDRVQDMSAPAQAAYLWLLARSWANGPLQSPSEILERRGFLGELWSEIAPCWTESPEGWIQLRLEAERVAVEEDREKKSLAGKRSAEVRAAKQRLLDKCSPPVERSMDARSTPPNKGDEYGDHTRSEEKRGGSGGAGDAEERDSHAESRPITQTTPSGGGARSGGRKKAPSRKPTEAQTRAAVKQRLGLQTIPGFEDAVVAWREALGTRKRWASCAALESRLRWLEQRQSKALEMVQICTEEAWTDPVYAEKRINERNGAAAQGKQAPRHDQHLIDRMSKRLQDEYQ